MRYYDVKLVIFISLTLILFCPIVCFIPRETFWSSVPFNDDTDFGYSVQHSAPQMKPTTDLATNSTNNTNSTPTTKNNNSTITITTIVPPSTSYNRTTTTYSTTTQTASTTKNRKKSCRAPYVSIAVSPKPGKFLQILWDVEKFDDQDWIGLFVDEPTSRKARFISPKSPVFKTSVQNTTGWITTNITEKWSNFRDNDFMGKCMAYWTAYFDANGTVVTSACLRTNPRWMQENKKILGNMKIKRMFIPGTHNSGSYIDHSNQMKNQNIVEKFVFTQDIDIFGQLMNGIRFLDLRIGAYPDNSIKWWINHGVYRTHPFKNAADDIKLFMNNTKEIVIVDFHEFPVGFKNNIEMHREFARYLISEFSPWLAKPNWSATCNQLWQGNKTLIIGYNNPLIVKEFSDSLWPPVSHKWANVRHIEALRQYLKTIVESRPSYSWGAMAELTPSLWSILGNRSNDLREMAQATNPIISNWFRGEWGRICNIVAVDFFRGSDIVRTAIRWNSRRARMNVCDVE